MRICGTMPDLTAEKAITMLRVDAQREEDRERITSGHSFAASSSIMALARSASPAKRLASSCKIYGKYPAGTEY